MTDNADKRGGGKCLKQEQCTIFAVHEAEPSSTSAVSISIQRYRYKVQKDTSASYVVLG